MSTNKTPNYQLHSWVKEDTFLMDEMNENFATLDGKLHQEVTALDGQIKTEVQTRTQQLAQKADQTALTAEIQKLNSALTSGLDAKANSSTVTTLEKKVQELKATLDSQIQLITGFYVGDAEKNRTINLDLPIVAVIVENAKGIRDSIGTFGGLALRDSQPCPYLSVQGSSFSVTHLSNGGNDQLNGKNATFHYAAFCQKE